MPKVVEISATGWHILLATWACCAEQQSTGSWSDGRKIVFFRSECHSRQYCLDHDVGVHKNSLSPKVYENYSVREVLWHPFRKWRTLALIISITLPPIFSLPPRIFFAFNPSACPLQNSKVDLNWLSFLKRSSMFSKCSAFLRAIFWVDLVSSYLKMAEFSEFFISKKPTWFQYPIVWKSNFEAQHIDGSTQKMRLELAR